MAADGSIVIETDITTEKIRNKLNRLNNDIERQSAKVEQLAQKYQSLLDGGNNEAMQSKLVALNNTFEQQSLKVEALERKYEELWRSGDTEGADAVKVRLEKAQIELAKTQEKIEELENTIKNGAPSAEIEAARMELERAQIALERMQTDAAAAQTSLDEATGGVSAMRAAAERVKDSFGGIEKRIKTIAKKVFVFTVITAALRSIKKYITAVMGSNTEFQASLARLRGSLLTAFQPILEVVIPIIQALINILSVAMSYIAKFTAWISGKSAAATAEAAKATYDQANATEELGAAAEKAKRQMSGLDEMNTWQSEAGGGAAQTPKVDFSGVTAELGALEGVISGVLLVLGAILAFSGASIPLGLGLMKIGAMGVANAVSTNWGEISTLLQGEFGAIMTLISGALLIIGLLLAFSGVALPLGIGLIVAGAGGLVTVMAANWDSIKEQMRGSFGAIMAEVSGALLIIGLILALTGVALPLGLALIATGAVGLASVVAFNWDYISENVKKCWRKIKTFWNANIAPVFTLAFWQKLAKKCGNGLIAGFEGAINGIIGCFEKMINWIIKGLNKISFDVPDWVPGIGGKKFGFNIDKVKFGRVNIPRLAQGAVIPANREFLAVLGDQTHGQNLEAPEELIRQIVREESGNGSYTFVAQLNGRTIFKEVIDQAKLNRKMTGKNAFALGGI